MLDLSSHSIRQALLPIMFRPKRASLVHQLEAEIIEGSETALGSMAKLISDNFSYSKATQTKLEIAIAHLKIEPLIKKYPKI